MGIHESYVALGHFRVARTPVRTVSKWVQIWSVSRTYEFMTLSRVGELMCVFARRFIIRLSQLSVVEKNHQHDR